MPDSDITDVDVTDPEFWTAPDEGLRVLAERDPVRRWPEGYWTVTDPELITAMSTDPGRFSSGAGVLIGDRNREVMAADSILYTDPPRHARIRRVVNRVFTARRVAALAPLVESITTSVLDQVDPGAVIDAVDELCAPIPMLVIAGLLGVPEHDLPDFRRWSDAIAVAATDPSDPRALEAAGFFGYFANELRERAREPREDLLSAIVTAGELSPQEQMGFCMSLLVAGNETTRSMFSGGMLALARNPAQRAALAADLDAVPTAVEEILRWVTPIVAMARTATGPVDLGGRAVGAGDYLVMLYTAANRDSARFGPDADAFDVTRGENPHLAFGIGEHYCLGAQLARLEGAVFFRQLLQRFPRYQVLGDPATSPSTLIRQLDRLPVVLTPVI